MTTWQRGLRLIVGVAAIAFAVVLAFAFKSRPAATGASAPSVAQTDPKAVVESASGRTLRVNREHEEIRIDYDKLLTYSDGSSRMMGVKVVTERAGGRVFTITARESQIGERESTIALNGDVQITATDGMVVRTDSATYAENDGTVHAPGMVSFSRGATSGTGRGMVYQKGRDLLTILESASVRVQADKNNEALQLDSGTADFDKPAKLIRFEHMVTAKHGGETVEADTATAHLTDDEQQLQFLELRGHSHVMTTPTGEGSLQALQARDMDVTYAADGRTIQHAVLTDEASVQLAGARRQSGRRISANTIDVALAPDGATPTAVAARATVVLTLPPEPGNGGRTITAESMDGRGEPGRGLTSARFDHNVLFRERVDKAERVARSAALDVKMGPSAIDEARFSGGVHFEQQQLKADSATANYIIASDSLELRSGDARTPPHMENDRIVIDAARLDVTLDGPKVSANGTVKSVLRPARSGESPAQGGPRVPSMFKQDQPVNVTADRLDYDGGVSKATYNGNVQLWQADTTIKGSALTIDDKNGNLTAQAAVTHATLLQPGKGDEKERVPSTGTAKDFSYDDSQRKATYTTDAHLIGPQGDLTATKIDMYLKESGDEVDRLEADEKITLREQSRRKTTGNHLTYFSADERYVVTGLPVTVVDDCGRETIGRTLTFYRTTDRIVVDGDEQGRTRTKGASSCP